MTTFNIKPIPLLAIVVASMLVGALGGAYAALNRPAIEVQTTVVSSDEICQPDTPKTEKCAVGVDLKLVAEKLGK